MKMLLSCLTLLLAACATDQQLVNHAPATVVEVPISVKCIDAKDIPPVPARSKLPDTGLKQRVATILADLDVFELYSKEADAALKACASK